MKKNSNGFTLAELLIVVAIIAVLVAVSIPIFTSQLRKAKESVDMANMRAAKVIASMYQLEDNNLSIVTGSGRSYDLAGFYDISKNSLCTRDLDLNISDWYSITNTIDSYGKIIEDSIIAVRFNNEDSAFEYYWFYKQDWQFYDEQWNLVDPLLQDELRIVFWL